MNFPGIHHKQFSKVKTSNFRSISFLLKNLKRLGSLFFFCKTQNWISILTATENGLHRHACTNSNFPTRGNCLKINLQPFVLKLNVFNLSLYNAKILFSQVHFDPFNLGACKKCKVMPFLSSKNYLDWIIESAFSFAANGEFRQVI